MTQTHEEQRAALEVALSLIRRESTKEPKHSFIGSLVPATLRECAAVLRAMLETFDEVDWKGRYVALEREVYKLTRTLEEHPEDYEGPCACALCLSYSDS